MLNSRHQAKLLKKWAPMLEAGRKIKNGTTKVALAQCLENTQNEFKRMGLLREENNGMPGNAIGRGKGLGNISPLDGGAGVMKGTWGYDKAGSSNPDFFIPNVVMPILRRIFPDLIATELVGVQPLTGPIGFALALRAKYTNNGHIGATAGFGGTDEIGYASPVTGYTGLSGANTLSADYPDDINSEFAGDKGKGYPTAADAWGAYTGDNNRWFGTGADVNEASEFASLNDGSYPTVGFDLIKTGVEAKTRKLGAQWSPELAEDMQAMHGIDVEAEMVNILSYEIGAEIDRQILTEMVKAAITGGNVARWTPLSADGLDQMGRLATLLTQITVEANQIALKTRRGNANFVVASPKVTSLLQQMSLNKYVSITGSGTMPTVPTSGVGAIQKMGLINDGQQLLVRDAYAAGDYALIGYKGTHPGDSGIIYCPYIPVQLSKVLRPDTFTPAIGARTRYGVMNSVWDASRYYTFMQIANLDSGVYHFAEGDRQFIAPTSKFGYPDTSWKNA